MFDYSVDGLAALTGADLSAAVADNHTVQVQAENRTLLLAAAWADLHSMDPDLPNGPLIERATVVGGDGTPEIGEFCCAEFGALLGVGMLAGRSLIGDALDVRHRLPLLWNRVRTVRSGPGRPARSPSSPGTCRGRPRPRSTPQ